MLHPVLKNTLAVAAGALLGMLVNMALITISPYIIPPPAGADLQTPEGLAAAMPLLQPQHFIMPWLAHALGSLAGAWLAARLAVYKKLLWAMLIGGFFLWGGIDMVRMLPTPAWFIAADLLGAYLPMSYLGWRLAD
jgi:hypothetical protein